MKDARYRIARGIVVEEEIKEEKITSFNVPGKMHVVVCGICFKPIERKGFIIQSNLGVIDMRNPANFDMICGSPHIGNRLNKWEATPPEEITNVIFHPDCFSKKIADIAEKIKSSEGI
jgi:hypothetical protein